MNYRNLIVIILCLSAVFSGFGKELHYCPDGRGGVMCVNGSTSFNRALYGAHSGFRLECSDMPEFGIYLPRMGGNLALSLPEGDCTATYIPGKMVYQQGGIEIEAQVGRTQDMAIWRIINHGAEPQKIELRFGCVSDKKFSRNGDLGVDPPDCFAFDPKGCEGNIYEWLSPEQLTVEYGQKDRKRITLSLPPAHWEIADASASVGPQKAATEATVGPASAAPYLKGKIQIADTLYLAYFPPSTAPQPYSALPALFAQCEQERAALANSVKIDTPDEWINPIGPALAIAADGLWSGDTWLHGAIGWRTQHLGWRGAYVGTALGWYDRAHKHFATYAANQITDVPQIYDHPCQDATLNLARAEKRWGTPMYSNGYICRRPGKKDEMSHYDMNLVYIDALVRYLEAKGDTAEIRQFLPTILRHLDWEKRNFDPDDDGLYDAYACIWASDALYYGGGAVTHSSAYNFKAAKELLMFKDLFWFQKARQCESVFAYEKLLFQEAQLQEKLFPIQIDYLKIYCAIMDSLWIPERGHWAEYKDRLGKRRTHNSPGLWTIYHAIDSDIGSKFQRFIATCYIDREIPHIPVIVENDSTSYFTLSSTPWTPYAWSINNVAIAEVMHTALAYWQANRGEEAFRLMKSVAMDNMYTGASPLNFGQISQYDAARGECYRDFGDPIGVWSRALVEGLFGINIEKAMWGTTIEPGFPANWDHASISLPHISYSFVKDGDTDIYKIEGQINQDNPLHLKAPLRGPIKSVRINGEETTKYYETTDYINIAKVEITIDSISNGLPVTIEIEREREFQPKDAGYSHTEGPYHFIKMYDGFSDWWVIDSISPIPKIKVPDNNRFDNFKTEKIEPLDLSAHFNDNVANIFKNKYLQPRPDVTTLQIPVNGIGEWCHPIDSADIYDAGHDNIIFTSLWDNYPDSVKIPLKDRASHAYIVLAGSTNHMQCLIPNAEIRISYTDGSTDTTEIIPPYNYAPIEQDYYFDGKAFALPDGLFPPLRVPLDGSEMRRSFGYDEVYGRRIPGGAGVAIDIPLNPEKELESLTMECLSNDIVIGIMNITLQRP